MSRSAMDERDSNRRVFRALADASQRFNDRYRHPDWQGWRRGDGFNRAGSDGGLARITLSGGRPDGAVLTWWLWVEADGDDMVTSGGVLLDDGKSASEIELLEVERSAATSAELAIHIAEVADEVCSSFGGLVEVNRL
jgi:hypothetical protein